MNSIFLRGLFVLLVFSSPAEAQEGLSVYTVNMEKKLALLASFVTTAKTFVGTAGLEQTVLVDVAANGQVVKVMAQEPIIDKSFAIESQRLIMMASPFAPLPVPVSNEFPMVRLHVTLALTSQPGLSIKRVELKGGYKYVGF